jgi:hypothetical protein
MWSEPSLGTYSISTGTLGLIAVDNTDNTLVGLTNNHVIVEDGFITSERNPLSGYIYNITDSKTYNNPFNYTFKGTITPRIIQFSFQYFNGNTYIDFNLENDNIGRPKRYYPLFENSYNYIDAALLTINEGTVDFSSTSQNGLPNTLGMPFATTSEINSLIDNNSNLYSSGARTGAKGEFCELYVQNLFTSLLVKFKRQKNDINIVLVDSIIIANRNLGIYPSDQGDSGSCVYADINGTNKIIGLLYAGNSTQTAVCRIDRLASLLNISAWDGSTINYTPSATEVSSFVRPADDDRVSIEYNGKTYWQTGLVSTKNNILLENLRNSIEYTIDSRINNKTPSVAKPIFTLQNHNNSNYVRNVNCWAYDLDLTPLSPWNSSGSNTRSGTLITPKHIIFSAHYEIATNSTVRFITKDNIVIDRTMVAKKTHPDYSPYYPDLTIGVLDSDVPNEINFCKVLPDNFFSYFTSLSSVNFIPVMITDQEEKALVAELIGFNVNQNDSYILTHNLNDETPNPVRKTFAEFPIVGDSGNPMIMFINNTPVILSCLTYAVGLGAGSGIRYQKSTLNAMITSLDAQIGYNSGYQLTDVDLNNFVINPTS